LGDTGTSSLEFDARGFLHGFIPVRIIVTSNIVCGVYGSKPCIRELSKQ